MHIGKMFVFNHSLLDNDCKHLVDIYLKHNCIFIIQHDKDRLYHFNINIENTNINIPLCIISSYFAPFSVEGLTSAHKDMFIWPREPWMLVLKLDK